MADIGETLREARMRSRIDISQVESATKIRAKYLRALENEEWDLLPGPTFVKTFLRTYAEYLGLDARSLVEDYKQRFERPSSFELTPFKPVAARGGHRRRRGPSPRWLVLPLLVLVVLAGLYLLGTSDLGTGDGTEADVPAPAPPAAEESVALRITATRRVRVCLLDARQRELLDGGALPTGERTETFTSPGFRVAFDGGRARMRVDGRLIRVDARRRPVGYEVTAGERPRRLARRALPECA